MPKNDKQSILVFLRDFRRTSDKTQMFRTDISAHFRTRLTHSIEVETLATQILRSFWEISPEKDKNYRTFIKMFKKKVSEDVVRTIALAHDLGHTPFGHRGERMLELLLTKNIQNTNFDNITDAYVYLTQENPPATLSVTSHFKHNVNSFVIVINHLFDTDERIEKEEDLILVDGVLKHTETYYRNAVVQDVTHNDYYDLNSIFKSKFSPEVKEIIQRKITRYSSIRDSLEEKHWLIKNEKEIINNALEQNTDEYLMIAYFSCQFPLYFEGQIVRIADEIAQRISDLDDSIRYYKTLDNNQDPDLMKTLIEALQLVQKIIVYELIDNKKTSFSLRDLSKLIFDQENELNKKKIEEINKSFDRNREETIAKNNSAYRYVMNLIEYLKRVQDLHSVIPIQMYNKKINLISQSIMKLTQDFFILDIQKEFERVIKRFLHEHSTRDYRELFEMPFHPISQKDKNTCKEIVKFSKHADYISHALQSFNVDYVILNETIENNIIIESNRKGGNYIVKLYRIYYDNPGLIREDEWEKIRNELIKFINYKYDNYETENPQFIRVLMQFLVQDNKENFLEAMKEIYESNSQNDENYDFAAKTVERKYAQLICHHIATMNNQYLINLIEEIEKNQKKDQNI